MVFIKNEKNDRPTKSKPVKLVESPAFEKSERNSVITHQINHHFDNKPIRFSIKFSLLVIVCFSAYYPIIFNDFLYHWDDQWVAMNNYTEGGINFNNLWAIISQFYHGQYAPFNEYYYVVLYSLFGYHPLAFHLGSLLLHILNVMLVYVCIYRLFELSRIIVTENIQFVAFLTALLFAVHPFNVESVAWISASKVLVYSFFYLFATLAFLFYLERKKLKYYFLTLFFFICSFLGKEQAVSFPFWLLLIFWLCGYRLNDRKIWLSVAPFFFLSLFFGLITILSQTGGKVLFDHEGYTMEQRIVYACYSFTEYFIKTAFPLKLSYLYPFPSVIGEPIPQWLLLYPVLLAIILFVFWKPILTHKLWLFALFYFFIHIAITLHIISLSRFTVVADRYAYMATIVFGLVISYYFAHYFRKWKSCRKWGLLVVFSAYLLYFGVYTNIRCRVWENTDTLKKEIRELLKKREDYKLKFEN